MKGEQGIYEIRNKVTGDVYIGCSKNTKSRMQGHKSELTKNKHHNKLLQNAWNRYGNKAFTFKHIETVYAETHLYIRERDWINKHKKIETTLYNIGKPMRDDKEPKKSILYTGPYTLPGWHKKLIVGEITQLPKQQKKQKSFSVTYVKQIFGC